MPLDPNRATAVYRFFDRQGRLMYVGIAYDPAERWKHHAAKTRWWKDTADNTIEWYDTRAEAERAEKVALRYEKPIYNKAGSVTPYQGPTGKRGMKIPRKLRFDDDIWEDFEKLCAEEGVTPEEAITAYIASRIKADRLERRREAARLRRLTAASDD
ncbi:GIY-YIG nuclease family protein [Streptomyces sp. SID5926]|nr:GIY-YIG nuclease family protein [Streptomyces sp. SID5926]